MSGWDLESNSGSSKKAEFTKFPVGITRVRIIDAEPHMRWTHWFQQHKRSINCPGKGCPICDVRKQQKANGLPYTHAMAKRLAIQVLNRETGNIEIMEQGVNFFKELKDIMMDLNDRGLTLLDADIKVRRRGSGKDDTSYRLDIDKEYPLSDEDLKLINSKLNLDDFFKPHTVEQTLRVLNGEEWSAVMSNQIDSDDMMQDEEEDYGIK